MNTNYKIIYWVTFQFVSSTIYNTKLIRMWIFALYFGIDEMCLALITNFEMEFKHVKIQNKFGIFVVSLNCLTGKVFSHIHYSNNNELSVDFFSWTFSFDFIVRVDNSNICFVLLFVLFTFFEHLWRKNTESLKCDI